MPRKPRILLDQIVIIDIEATCWRRKPPKNQTNEIIEIGICMLDIATTERLAKESILVKPTRSAVSRFCTDLTTLTQDMVDEGIDFASACQHLIDKYGTKYRAWASYGDYDRQMFVQQCQDFGVEYPFSDRHLNVKTLFAIIHNLSREVGMARALEMCEMPMEGTHHRGHDDAWNTAALLGDMLLKRREVSPATELRYNKE